jgi:ABC-2 type transport system ATP-binding protein
MISFDNISFGYDRERLFDQLTLQLKAGHIYGLLGQNGAGKSSLLKMTAGLVFPQRGTCRVMNHEPRLRKPSFMSQLYFLPEESGIPQGSAMQYAALHAVFYPNFDHKLYEKFLSDFQVNPTQKLERISFGQRKKVMIAFALAAQTPLLIMDEPTNGLDISSKSMFRKLVAGAMTEERCIIISTHQVRDLDMLIDHILILHEGKITYQQDLNTLSEKPDIEEIFNQAISVPI